MFNSTKYVTPEYTCPVHGDVGNVALTIVIGEEKTTICVYCFRDFLLSSGVREATLKESNAPSPEAD